MIKSLPANAGDTHFHPWVRKIPWSKKWQIVGLLGLAGGPDLDFWFPLKWWDSPPPSGNLEPANQHAPSKKKGTYQGKAEKPHECPSLKKACEGLGQ